MYLSEGPGLGAAKIWVHRRRPARPRSGARGVSGLGELGVPIFDTQCPDPPGCAPLALTGCRPALRQAVHEAIRIATLAADKLDALVGVPVAARSADAQRTARIFTRYFGHDPLRAVTWAGNEESAVSVAKRFRSVARELNGGRRVVFHCRPTRDDCARNDHNDLTCCAPTENAWFSTGVPNGVTVCDGFWNPPADLHNLPARQFRAGIIIHEMLHMLFEHLRDTGHGRIRNACYEAFALHLAHRDPDPFDVCQCRGTTPCPP